MSALRATRWVLAAAVVILAVVRGVGGLMLLTLALLCAVHVVESFAFYRDRNRIERVEDLVFSAVLSVPTSILGVVLILALGFGLHAVAGDWGLPILVAILLGSAVGAVLAYARGRSRNRLRGPTSLV